LRIGKDGANALTGLEIKSQRGQQDLKEFTNKEDLANSLLLLSLRLDH